MRHTRVDEERAEYATCGALLLSPQRTDELSGWLHPDDFAKPVCGQIYGLLTEMRAARQHIDPVTVLAELRRRGELRADGYPTQALVRMVEEVPSPVAAPHYGRLVLENALSREVGGIGDRLQQISYRDRGDADELLRTASEQAGKLSDLRARWKVATGERGAAYRTDGGPRARRFDYDRAEPPTRLAR
jgi:replicative DNA helicase